MPTDRDFQYDLRPALQPLLLPACALAAGVALGDVAGVPIGHAATGGLLSAAVALAARRMGHATLGLVALLAVFGLAGACRSAFSRSQLESRPVRRLVDTARIRPGDALLLAGDVEDIPERPPSAARMGLALSGLRLADGTWIDAPGRATVAVRLTDSGLSSGFDALGLTRGTPVRVSVRASDDLAFRNPGVETLRERIRRAGFDLAVQADGPGAIELAGPARGCPVLRQLSAIRVRGLAEIDAAFSPRTAGVLRALLLGDESRLDESTAEDYRRSGAYHVLVISGAHVALLAGLCVWIGARCSRSPWLRLVAATGPAWLYSLILGSPAPVVRAALALTVASAAPMFGRRAPPPNTLALAAIVVLVVDPTSIRDPSFQLTFSAVAAIVGIAAPLVERIRDVGGWRPHRAAPFPPVCSRAIRVVAETLFWDERRFGAERKISDVRFGMTKSAAAVWLDRLRIQALVRRVVVGVWIAVAVQVVLAPLSVTSFGRLTLAGTIWAVAVEALLGAALVAGLGFLTMRALAPAASAPFEWIADRLVRLSNDAAAGAPDGWPVASPTGWSALALCLAPIALAVLAACISAWHPLPRIRVELGERTSRIRWSVAATVAVIVLVASVATQPTGPPADGRLHVLFLDVGQGDAAFVRFPDGTTMLIDAGGRPRRDEPLGFDDGEVLRADRFDIGDRVVSATLLALGYSRVDWFVASHADVDHVGGFAAVSRRLSVGRVVIGSGPDTSERKFAASADARGSPVVEIGAGEALEFGGARLEVVWPTTDAPEGNDGSLVFRIVYGSRCIVFTGDIEDTGEAALLGLAANHGWDLRADVLKVPHHGSRGASSSAFIAAVAPMWAVVSAPRQSPYGHPHAETLARLREAGAMVVQTGIDGAIGFTTDGHRIELQRIAEPGTQLLPADFDHGARSVRTKLPGGPK